MSIFTSTIEGVVVFGLILFAHNYCIYPPANYWIMMRDNQREREIAREIFSLS